MTNEPAALALIRIHPRLRDMAKAHAALKHVTLQEFVEAALRDYIFGKTVEGTPVALDLSMSGNAPGA